jgi:hypothetical protein
LHSRQLEKLWQTFNKKAFQKGISTSLSCLLPLSLLVISCY